jgi:CheY-like chemotaxis protein
VKILVLDDNPDVVRMIECFLRTLDHEVSAFTESLEALLWIKDVNPEVIIADLDMPGVDGFEFVRKVRAHSAFANTPIICITGTDATDEQIAASGFISTLRKPITLSDLMVALEDVKSATRSPTE